MPIDAGAIATQIGTGDAQILDNRAYDMYSDYAKTAQSKASKQKQDVVNAFKGLENVKLDGFAAHQQDLLTKKNEIYDALREGFSKSGYGWEYGADPNITRKVNELQSKVAFSKQIQSNFATEYAKLQNGKDTYDPASAKEVEDFYKMPLDKQYEYVNHHETVPMLKPKEIVFDPVKFTTDYAATVKPKKVGGYEVLPNGDIVNTDNATYDKYAAGKEILSRPDGDKYSKYLLTDFNGLGAKVQQKYIDESQKTGTPLVAILAAAKIDPHVATSFDQDLSRKPGGGLNLTFGKGSASTDKYNFNYQETGEQIHPTGTGTGEIATGQIGTHVKTPTIAIKRKPGVEAKPTIFIEDGNEIDMAVSGLKKYADGWYIVGETTREVPGRHRNDPPTKKKELTKVPLKDNTAYFESAFGLPAEDIIQGINGKTPSKEESGKKSIEGF